MHNVETAMLHLDGALITAISGTDKWFWNSGLGRFSEHSLYWFYYKVLYCNTFLHYPTVRIIYILKEYRNATDKNIIFACSNDGLV